MIDGRGLPDAVLASDVWAATRAPLPLPGAGDTWTRFQGLLALGRADLSLAKLAEPHFDAQAILAELGGGSTGEQTLWAVWAAEPPDARLTAQSGANGWILNGSKAFGSGANLVTHALVTATAHDGPRLFAIDVAATVRSGGIEIGAPDWVGTGMARADTRRLSIADVSAQALGPPRGYVERPGFWHGACGVAACWLGGAHAIVQRLIDASRRRDLDPHALAHLGAVTAALDASTAQLHDVATEIDRDPQDHDRAARRRALSLRATVVSACEQALTRVAHALGPAPLAFDADHARRVADLAVFIRQHHDERDLAELGSLVSQPPAQKQ